MGIWNDIDKELIETVGNVKIGEEDIGKQRGEKLQEYKDCKDAYIEYCGFLKEKYKSDMAKEEIKELRYKIADKYLREFIDYKPNAEKLLKYLKEKGFILCIASTTNDNTINTYKKYNKNINQKAPFDEFFNIVYSKGAVSNLKPSPEVHNKILMKLDIKKDECIIVEDSLIGAEAAKNAGIECIIMYDKYSDYDRDKINELATYKFKDFEDMLDYIREELD